MKLKITAVCFCILILGVSTVQATLPELIYEITIPDQSMDSPDAIHVRLKMQEIVLENSPYVVLYAGNIEITALAARTTVPLPISRRNEFVFLGPLAQKQVDVEIQYAVLLGRLAKHGHQGYLSNNFALFGGEQLFLIPSDGRAASISVQFNVPSQWTCILPQAETKSSMTISDSSWRGIYNLMKNNYACGQFKKFTTKNQNFWFPRNRLSKIQPQKIMHGTQKIIQFFATHLQHPLENYQFCFLPKSTSKEYLMGGIGPNSLGFTLNPDYMRDWQLLAHRLFHVYFDRVIHLKPLYAPPWLWLQEALAGYYEILAPAALGTGFSQYQPEHVFAELYRRYLYFYFKDPALFQISPMQEKVLTYEGQTEFLHYTQAPLTVFALIHEILQQNSGASPDLLWYWLSKIEPAALDELPVNLDNFSNSQLSLFFAKHIDGVEPLDLRKSLENFSEKPGADPRPIINSLQEYEHLLWTWFRHVPELFPEKSIETENFGNLLKAAEARKITFAPPEQEKLVRDFSPTIYGLLKIHFLKLAVCQIDLSANERNLQLQKPACQEKWQDFLQQLPN